MFPEKIEERFYTHLQAIQILQQALECSFLDAYIEHVENINDQYTIRVIEGVPNQESIDQLTPLYEQLKADAFTAEEKRKISQLLLLKGAQTEKLQANHQLTPDGIGFLFVYLIEQLYMDQKANLRMLDLTTGMGNLLFTIVNNLALAKYHTTAIGVDNDETLLAVAAANSQWFESEVTLFHQDGLQDLLIEPVDVAIGDLPVGYYPIDEKAKDFIVHAENEHTYAHHLLIEQAMKYVKEAGFGIFLMPSQFLESPQSDQFKKLLQEKVYLQGIIQLPDDLFRNEHSKKSIILLQNRGQGAKQVSEVLLARLQTLKQPEKIAEFFKEFAQWKETYLN